MILLTSLRRQIRMISVRILSSSKWNPPAVCVWEKQMKGLKQPLQWSLLEIPQGSDLYQREAHHSSWNDNDDDGIKAPSDQRQNCVQKQICLGVLVHNTHKVKTSFIYSSSVTASPHQGHAEAGVHPSWLWVRSRVHPGQVASRFCSTQVKQSRGAFISTRRLLWNGSVDMNKLRSSFRVWMWKKIFARELHVRAGKLDSGVLWWVTGARGYIENNRCMHFWLSPNITEV